MEIGFASLVRCERFWPGWGKAEERDDPGKRHESPVPDVGFNMIHTRRPLMSDLLTKVHTALHVDRLPMV
jgi:hypothetical protein